MQQIVEQQKGRQFWLFDKSVFGDISNDYFKHDYWQSQNAVTGTEHGRGTTLFLKFKDHELVLRHYLRGGLVSKFNKDRYWFRNWKKTRSIAEFWILNEMRKFELPVPMPIAAQVRRYKQRYRADIIIERIPGARDLLSVLKDSAKSPQFYSQLAKVVSDFHKQGVFHADLNIQNILYDTEAKFWLIDFDRAKILKPDTKWQQKNLKRLKRSFIKEQGRHQIHWSLSDWEVFEAAYLIAMSGGKGADEE